MFPDGVNGASITLASMASAASVAPPSRRSKAMSSRDAGVVGDVCAAQAREASRRAGRPEAHLSSERLGGRVVPEPAEDDRAERDPAGVVADDPVEGVEHAQRGSVSPRRVSERASSKPAAAAQVPSQPALPNACSASITRPSRRSTRPAR